MVLVLQATEDQELFLRQHVEHWHKINGRPLPELLKTRGEILLGLFDHAYQKSLLRLQELYKFPVTDKEKAALAEGLPTAGYMPYFRTKDFDWYKPAGEQKHYRRIVVGQDTVLFSADFLEDLREMEQMIVSIIGKIEKQMVHSKLSDNITPEDLILWFLILKDQETERWFYTSMADLDDQTPEQILAQPGGKERILTLLEGYTAHAVASEFGAMEEILVYICERVKQIEL